MEKTLIETIPPVENYTTIVNSCAVAVALARKWKEEGKYDLFRGQGSNWKLVSSIHRVKGQRGYNKHLKRSDLLFGFMQLNPVLKDYCKNQDQFIAIAQHYGVATNFIDFTEDPIIAAWFATHSKANKIGQYACIICAKRKDFEETMLFTKPLLDKYYVNGHQPEFVSIDVHDLWRLQAQKGHFLYTPFSGIEHYYPFDRILFPYDQPFEAIRKEYIYPLQKSIIETNIDHFLTAERRSRNMERIMKWIGEERTSVLPENEIGNYTLPNARPHNSWRGRKLRSWLKPYQERWDAISHDHSIEVTIPYQLVSNDFQEDLSSTILNVLQKHQKCRSHTGRLMLQRIQRPFNKKMQTAIQTGCDLIWHGMRNLPYTDDQIAMSLANFILLYNFYSKDRMMESAHDWIFGRTVYIVMTADDGSNTHAYVNGYHILQAARENILDILRPEYRDICADNPVALTQLVFDPSYLFQFERLQELFATDVIPSQTLLELTNANPVIYFNPAYCKIFGLA
ncbi:MAG: hypothetical protein JWQ34_2110 [Mucilaginibacter sp.]|uniref:FRG domain-containing protein n=1 Tax=Mucilaginibacter sp. TaxID=1882438 RepID=UPI002624218D|nr:FRG domain-containing protein [Mucilaginibacter sp.]MDB5003885.1 hypothetical protein [Mucilaginibacter sp.]